MGHANALDHQWGKNCFYVYDGWCNPAKESHCTKGAFDVNGHKASNCGIKAKNRGFKTDKGTTYLVLITRLRNPKSQGTPAPKKTGKHKNKSSKGNNSKSSKSSSGSGSSKNNHSANAASYNGTTDTIFFGTVNGDSACATFEVANVIIEIMTYGIGALGAIGITVVGIMYLTAKVNEAQTAKAKKRMLEIVIGLVAYAMVWAVMNWLMPGGVFNGECGGPDSSTAKTTVESSDSVSLKK